MSMLQIMIRCPVTGRPVFTGLMVEHQEDAAHGASENAVGCPHCDDLHSWRPEEAWFRPETLAAE